VPPEPAKAHGVRNALVGAAAVVVVLIAFGLASETDEGAPTALPMPTPMPAPTPIPAAAPAPSPAALPLAATPERIDLSWRDYVLRYTGTLSWDGRSNAAQISMRIVDGNTGASLGSRDLPATMHLDAPGRVVFSAAVPIAGDSQTAGAHSHAIHLVFEMQPNGRWMFVRNCMAVNNCWEAGT